MCLGIQLLSFHTSKKLWFGTIPLIWRLKIMIKTVSVQVKKCKNVRTAGAHRPQMCNTSRRGCVTTSTTITLGWRWQITYYRIRTSRVRPNGRLLWLCRTWALILGLSKVILRSMERPWTAKSGGLQVPSAVPGSHSHGRTNTVRLLRTHCHNISPLISTTYGIPQSKSTCPDKAIVLRLLTRDNHFSQIMNWLWHFHLFPDVTEHV